jgi:biopolymer transport protein ExbB
MLPIPLLQSSSAAASKLGNLYDLILAGGPLMVPIGLCSVVALGYFVERSGALAAGRLAPSGFADGLAQALAQSPAAALDWCVKQPKVAIARVMAAGLRRWHEGRAGLERAVEETGGREVAVMMQRLRPLVIITAIAPLLGLLGTVTGMITSFRVMALQKGVGSPELLAGGIAEALVTTAAGLFVAIPVQVVYYWLRAKVDRFAAASEVTFDDVIVRALDAAAPAAAAAAQQKAA